MIRPGDLKPGDRVSSTGKVPFMSLGDVPIGSEGTFVGVNSREQPTVDFDVWPGETLFTEWDKIEPIIKMSYVPWRPHKRSLTL